MVGVVKIVSKKSLGVKLMFDISMKLSTPKALTFVRDFFILPSYLLGSHPQAAGLR